MRRLTHSLIPLALTLVLGACSSAPQGGDSEEGATTAERKDGYRCDRVVQAGSRMPTRRCTTSAQREAEAQEAARIMRTRTVTPQSN
ncbi:hypothetical protein [Ferrimonas balearica]|uniref:hypothetical protein n=1 Tax=Ferrimonas balearica TaxID=44012 RepID=UPI001C9951D6|nr:hypothetical protein [Ferrimonas balearica]MBY5992374.1 hypothetical protein [Ferrimonas balearica]